MLATNKKNKIQIRIMNESFTMNKNSFIFQNH